jgi:hypothetical protein
VALQMRENGELEQVLNRVLLPQGG